MTFTKENNLSYHIPPTQNYNIISSNINAFTMTSMNGRLLNLPLSLIVLGIKIGNVTAFVVLKLDSFLYLSVTPSNKIATIALISGQTLVD